MNFVREYIKYCIVKNCFKKTVGKGFCRKHYHRFRNHGHTNLVRFPIESRCCKNCNKFFKPNDNRKQIYCSKKCHYSFHSPKKCKIKKCNKISNTYYGGAKGFCCMHYKRFIRNGDPNKTIYHGSGFIKEGYYMFSNKIKRARLIMEKHIGRQLKSNEHIHHINENKLDDRIENLQIVSQSQHAKIHNKLRKLLKINNLVV